MTHEQFEKAADYWKNKGITAMPKEELKKAVEEYIAANNTCALATGTGDYVRCTPIEYSYHNDKFWMFSEGGEVLRRMKMYVWLFSINMMDLAGLRAYRLWEKPN